MVQRFVQKITNHRPKGPRKNERGPEQQGARDSCDRQSLAIAKFEVVTLVSLDLAER